MWRENPYRSSAFFFFFECSTQTHPDSLSPALLNMISKRSMVQCKLFSTIPLSSTPYLPDYPHKYGSEGGCADHSVFDRMKKYQTSGVEEEPVKVSATASITTKPPPPPSQG